ncbi:FecR family protein, partial [Acidocella sp.]|uniref:FecR family protein n=1 Tax=Acidocella sp. TaxID=50710 RepID=UPI002602C8CC
MKNSTLSLALTLGLLAAGIAGAVEQAGSIRYMSGTLVAQRADGGMRVLTPKSKVEAGDLLVTGKNSYAQVVMNDGTKMTLRPESNLKIEAYRFQKSVPQSDNAVFRLLKGGFRTVTGLIGKRGNKDAYQLRAAGATIGIRGTDFTSRLCAAGECGDGAEAVAAKPKADTPKPAGRVMRISGGVVAKEEGGKLRKLGLGAPVYEGDTLQSDLGAYAVVVFRDGGRITLQQSSLFKVETFKYDKEKSEESIALRLIKGGVRVVTGLIGRVNHDNYKFKMPGATIGIRGTGFDVWCNGPCAEGDNVPLATLGGAGRRDTLWSQYAEAGIPGRLNDAGVQTSVSGLYTRVALGEGDPMNGGGVYVWSGSVVMVAPGGSFTVAVNQAAMLSQMTGKPVRIMVVPAAVQQNDAPRPDMPVDMDELFGEGQDGGGGGLYVTVNDGQVILSRGEQAVNLGKGESGFSDGQLVRQLATTPGFMR